MHTVCPDKDSEKLRSLARAAVARLQSSGFVAYWAGGCVRDMLSGRPPKDIDIATSATPDQILALFPGGTAVGKAFGVVRAPVEGEFFEVATFRQDHAYRDGRRPEGVSFSDPETDARRRDFTINAMFYDPVAERLHDFVDGQADLAARLVRCVGDPDLRIQEDHLRMLRAVRFAGTFDYALEAGTRQAIRSHARLISRISAERIREELTRLLMDSIQAGDAVRLLDELGLLEPLLPEVAAMKGQVQPPEFHPEGDVFQHTILMLNLMKAPSAHLAYCVLLHDVGKPAVARHEADRIRFDKHAGHGAEVARQMLERLRFPNADIETIAYCVQNHMRFMDVTRMRRATLRRLVGAPTFPLELELHRLDCLASHGDLENYDFLVKFQAELASEPVLPKAWVNGRDIMAMGVAEGPMVGVWREKAYEAQIEGRFEGRQVLVEWLKAEIEDTQRHGTTGGRQ